MSDLRDRMKNFLCDELFDWAFGDHEDDLKEALLQANDDFESKIMPCQGFIQKISQEGGGQNRPYRIFDGAAPIKISITQFPRGGGGQELSKGGANAPPLNETLLVQQLHPWL